MFHDQDYFKSEKKGEIYELKQELRGEKRERRKDALKRIISNMTIGKDMSGLFTEVINLIQTDNIELKKLVYLYLISYARTHSDLALLAVNTFVKDCDDNNPLIRALAVRTMGYICVPNITEYLCDPLRKCLNDEDPYVRKTAAICVLKLFNFNQELTIEQGFVKKLNDLLRDPNPSVLTNSLVALTEIMCSCKTPASIVTINFSLVSKLLTALNECTEWGQIVILDFIALYDIESETEAQSICERVVSRLSHANSAVVLSTIKVIIKAIGLFGETAMLNQHLRKMGPPLVTMLSLEPEIQYVALRNINLITQKYPSILKNELKSFLIKYNDPIYIKIEKLSIIIKLVDESNVDQVVAELKEYSTEVDVEFVRRSVRAIGTCALKVESAADRCVTTLLDLIETKISYVVQEAVIVARDIMRRFPGKYESVIEKLSDNLYSLEEPNARAALIWIMGEFAERIDNVAEILQVFINTFFDESSTVQLQLLTAVVKLFLKRPQENQNLVQEVLSMVTQQIDNPDIRDRGFIYWRLLSTDPDAAKAVVLADKPLISPESDNLDEALLQELLLNLSSLSSVYHKLPQTLIDGSIKLKNQLQKKLNNNITAKASLLQDKQENTILLDPVFKAPNQQPNDHRDLLDLDFSAPPQPSVQIQTNQNVDLLSDIFTKVQLHPHVQSSAPDKEENKVDLFNVVQSQFSRDVYTPPSVLWLSSQMAKGLEVFGQFLYTPSLSASLTLSNQSLSPFSNFSLQLNKNFFGLSIKDASTFPQCLLPKQIANISITFDFSGVGTLNSTLDSIQVALKNNVDVFYFTVKFPLHFSFKDPLTCCISENQFLVKLTSIPSSNRKEQNVSNWTLTQEKIESKLTSLRIFSLNISTPPCVGGFCILNNDEFAVIQVFLASGLATKFVVCSSNIELVSILVDLITAAFNSS